MKLMFLGDLMVSDGDKAPQYSKQVKELLNSSSLIIANCESPVSDEVKQDEKRKYWFKFVMPMTYLNGLTTEQVDSEWVLSLANNHMGDQGHKGFKKSETLLRESDKITPVGIKSKKARSVVHPLPVESIKIGLLAWTRWMNFEDSFSGNEEYAVYRDKDIFTRKGKNWECKINSITGPNNEHDLIIAYPHWDWEFQHFPHKDTVDQASCLVNHGVDLIVGSHTHTLQAMDRFPDNTLCFYGLGNFVGLTRSKATKLSGILEIRIAPKTKDRQAEITGYTLHPTVQQDLKQSVRDTVSKIVLMSEYDGEYKTFYRKRLKKMYSGLTNKD